MHSKPRNGSFYGWRVPTDGFKASATNKQHYSYEATATPASREQTLKVYQVVYQGSIYLRVGQHERPPVPCHSVCLWYPKAGRLQTQINSKACFAIAVYRFLSHPILMLQAVWVNPGAMVVDNPGSPNKSLKLKLPYPSILISKPPPKKPYTPHPLVLKAHVTK